MSTGGQLNKWKSLFCSDPHRARAYAHLFISRKQCLTWTWGSWAIRNLQSSTKGDVALLEWHGLDNKSTIALRLVLLVQKKD